METSSSLVARIGGLAAVLGGLLWSAKAFYDRNDAPPWPTDVTDTLFFLVLLLFLAGLTGLYARCRGRLGEWETVFHHGVRRGLGRAGGVYRRPAHHGARSRAFVVVRILVVDVCLRVLRHESRSGVLRQLDHTKRGATPLEGFAAHYWVFGNLPHPRGRSTQQRTGALPKPGAVDGVWARVGGARLRTVVG